LGQWEAIDIRRGKSLAHRRRQTQLIRDRYAAEYDKGESYSSFCKRDSVKRSYADAYAKLQAPYTVDEVSFAMDKMRDVGSGTDSLEPVVFTCHQSLHKCSECRTAEESMENFNVEANSRDSDLKNCNTADVACRLFNSIREEACIPERWRFHRCLLHYKGKGSDPHCVDNYRGLGIDQALLKLLSLVMLERLNLFLEVTGGLSRSQGGFQRRRGTAEQVLTLKETVGAALRRKNVYISFIDIERAYDSVIHPILWKSCIDKGIDGFFLATLQAIYYKAEAQLDVGGVMLDPVPLETGVVQGNPLSPPLFNIYIDGAIRALEEAGQQHALSNSGRCFGLPLPRISDRHQTWAQQSELKQDDYMASLFYADDGALTETDQKILQIMMDLLAMSLSKIGLRINVGKTKFLLVAGFETRSDAYSAIVSSTLNSPLKVYDTNIKMVDEFDYLGVMMNCRWDWSSAWREAIKQFKMAFGNAVHGGFHRTGTLESMLQHAEGKIFCHLTYIMALTGAGGGKTTAEFLKAQKEVEEVLKTIVGSQFVSGEALMIETGLWDVRTRIFKLLLRFWCKIAASDPDSFVYRAVCLSIEQFQRPYDSLVYLPRRDGYSPWYPSGRLNGGEIVRAMWSRRSENHLHRHEIRRQPWAQQLIDAAIYFGLNVDLVLCMKLTALLRVQVLASEHMWTDIDVYDSALVQQMVQVPSNRLRFIGVGDNRPNATFFRFSTSMPVNLPSILQQWSPTLKLACFDGLQRRGNQARQIPVKNFLHNQISNNTPLRLWALLRSGAYKRPYWQSIDAVAARRLVRMLLGYGPQEDCVRRRPFSVHVSLDDRMTARRHKCRNAKSVKYILIPRLDNGIDRVCYLCGQCGESSRSSWQHETLEHMLFYCPHPDLTALRLNIRHALSGLAMAQDTLELAKNLALSSNPNDYFKDEAVLLSVFMLCDSVGQLPILQPVPLRGQSLLLDPTRLREATDWTATILRDWQSRLRDVRVTRLVRDVDNTPGGRLVDIVVKWAFDVFIVHRRATRGNVEYRERRRDPVELLRGRKAPKRTPAQGRNARLLKKKQARRRPKGPVARAIAVRQRTERRRVRNSLSVAKETKKRKAASLLLPYVAIDVCPINNLTPLVHRLLQGALHLSKRNHQTASSLSTLASGNVFDAPSGGKT